MYGSYSTSHQQDVFSSHMNACDDIIMLLFYGYRNNVFHKRGSVRLSSMDLFRVDKIVSATSLIRRRMFGQHPPLLELEELEKVLEMKLRTRAALA